MGGGGRLTWLSGKGGQQLLEPGEKIRDEEIGGVPQWFWGLWLVTLGCQAAAPYGQVSGSYSLHTSHPHKLRLGGSRIIISCQF